MVARGAAILGDHWTPLLLRDLAFGITKFDQLQADLGLSRNVLAQRLRRMVDDGLVERQAYQHNPKRFDYELTAKGRDLVKVVLSLWSFAQTWLSSESDVPLVLVHECGHEAAIVQACGHCGGEVSRDNSVAVRGPGYVPGYFSELDSRLDALEARPRATS